MTSRLLPDIERVAGLLTDLASLPSPSRRERSVADYVITLLDGLGLGVVEDAAAQAIGGDTGNLWCRVPGDGDRPALALFAHLDTVEPGGAIIPVLQDGVVTNAREGILGADNKAAVAAVLHATELLLSSGRPFPTYELVFTVAEEVGVLGARHLPARVPHAPVAAVFDSAGPVGGIVVRAPNQQSIHAVFRGKAAHAGFEPEKGRSAIVAAARAVAAMRLGRLDDGGTANVGVIRGGVATNIVPDECEVLAECRSHDEETLAATETAMVEALQHGATEVGVDVEITLSREYHGFSLSPRSGVVRLAKAALEDMGVVPHVLSSTGGSDANVLNARGIPTVNLDCGMAAVHSPDEHIPLDELERLTRLVLALVALAPEYGHGHA